MSSPFRLLITTDTTSEIWNYTLKLCESILLYIKADILLVNFGNIPDRLQKEEAEKLNIELRYINTFPEINDINTIKQAEKALSDIVKDFKPNIVHLNHYLDISDSVDCPVIITNHEDISNDMKWLKSGQPDLYKELSSKILNNANGVILTSRFMAERLIKEYNLRNKFRVIYNGINVEPANNIPEKFSIVTEGDLYDRTKNLGLLLKAAAKIPDSIKIKVIGNKGVDNSSKRIEWLGKLSLSEKLEVYRNSSIFLALSSSESFGFSSMVAAYSNCALLTNDIPIHRELWGDCACIYEKNNINSFMRNLNNLIENERLLKFTAKNCQAKAVSAFNLKRMGLEYINFYKSTLQRYIISRKNSKIDNSVQVS